MKKFCAKTFYEAFLYNAPHNQMKRLQKLVPYPIKNANSFANISDEMYLDFFISQVHFDHLIFQDYMFYASSRNRSLNNEGLFFHPMQRAMGMRQDKGK